MTELELIDFVLLKVKQIHPNATAKEQVAYALGFLAAQIKQNIDLDSRAGYQLSKNLKQLADKRANKKPKANG